MRCQEPRGGKGAQGEIRRVESCKVVVGGKGARPPQLHGSSKQNQGWKIGAKRKRGRRGAELNQEGEGKRSGEKERSDVVRASRGRSSKAKHDI